MRGAVSYFRLARGPDDSEPVIPDSQAKLLRSTLERRGLRLIETFIDAFGRQRAGFPQLARALALCRERDATLVVPHLGISGRDPLLFETLAEGNVDFLILDRPALTRSSLLSQGLVTYRSDPRVLGERVGMLEEAEKAAVVAVRKR